MRIWIPTFNKNTPAQFLLSLSDDNFPLWEVVGRYLGAQLDSNWPDMASAVQQDILRLTVPVDDALLVQMPQAQQNLGRVKSENIRNYDKLGRYLLGCNKKKKIFAS